MKIAIVAFERITALDAVGPYEVLTKVPGADVSWVGLAPGFVTADGGLRIGIDAVLEDVGACDVLLVPGGYGTRKLAGDPRVLDWLRRVHATTRYTASVCTGSIVLAAAGLLDGQDATTHWARYELLQARGAHPVAQRIVRSGKVITAAGVSAGVDMALSLAALLTDDNTACGIQLAIEYDPRPPFDSGSPDKAPKPLVQRVRASLDARE